FFDGVTKISAIRLFADQLQLHMFTPEEEKSTLVPVSEPLRYLYDPDVAVTKSGAFKTIAKRFNFFKLHTHTHLYTSDTLNQEFPGRIFNIQQVYSIPAFKKNNTLRQANVATKNFPVKVDEIRKRYKIKDGGPDFLFFTTDATGNHIVIRALKII